MRALSCVNYRWSSPILRPFLLSNQATFMVPPTMNVEVLFNDSKGGWRNKTDDVRKNRPRFYVTICPRNNRMAAGN